MTKRETPTGTKRVASKKKAAARKTRKKSAMSELLARAWRKHQRETKR